MTGYKHIKKKSVKKVDRFLYNWRNSLETIKVEGDRAYAEALFMGAWMAFSDKEAAFLFTKLTWDELNVVLSYPIWM